MNSSVDLTEQNPKSYLPVAPHKRINFLAKKPLTQERLIMKLTKTLLEKRMTSDSDHIKNT